MSSTNLTQPKLSSKSRACQAMTWAICSILYVLTLKKLLRSAVSSPVTLTLLNKTLMT